MDEQESKVKALVGLLGRLPSHMVYYASIVGTFAVTLGAPLPAETVITGVGVGLMTNLIQDAVSGKKMSNEDLKRHVKEAIEKTNIDQLARAHETSKDLARGFGHTLRQLNLLEIAVKSGEVRLTELIIEEFVRQAERIGEIREDTQKIILMMQGLTTREQGDRILALGTLKPSLEKPKVFLSYARADDEPFVRKLYTDLHRLGIEAWYDRENMTADGSPFTQAIGDAIRGSQRLLFVVGPRSVASQYCTGEWTLAQSLCIPVVPLVRLGDYDAIPQTIGKGHAVDCRASRAYGAVLDELDRLLKDPVHPLAAIGATPALPKAYLTRENYLTPLKEAIRSGDPLVAITSKQHQDAAALVGVGGIGKTTIAAALCHDCEVRRTFDVIHWIDTGPNRKTPQDAAPLMRAAADGDSQNYQDIDAARAAFAAYLHGKKTLIVLDDVWDVSIAKPFQFAAVDCRILITTRQKRIVDLLGAKGQAVDKLTDDEAIEVLSGRAGRDLDDADARKIARMLDGHALAVSLAGAWLSQNPTKSAADLLARFAKRPDFRDLKLDAGDKNLNLELALSLSYADLTDSARGHFRALGLLPVESSVSAGALGALWSIDDDIDAEDAIGVLVGASLLDPSPPTPLPQQAEERGESTEERYTLHPLLRAYARALLDDAGEADAVSARHFAYFAALHGSDRDHTDPDYLQSITIDVANLQAALIWGFAHSPEPACDLLNALNNFFRVYQPTALYKPLLEYGLKTAQTTPYPQGEANTLKALGDLSVRVAELDAAQGYYDAALPLYRTIGDRLGEANTLRALGDLSVRVDELDAAQGYYAAALPLFRTISDRMGEAYMLKALGDLSVRVAELDAAQGYYNAALPLFRTIGTRVGQLNTLRQYALLEKQTSNQAAAIAAYEECLALADTLPAYRNHPVVQGWRREYQQMLNGETDTPQDSQEEQAAEVMRMLVEVYAQGGVDAVRQMLKEQVPDEVIEQLITLLAGGE